MEIPVNSENSYVGDEMPCILGTQQDRVGGPLGPPRPCVLMGRIALPGMTQQKVHWHMGARLNEVKGEEQGSKQNKGFFLHLVQADMQWLKRCLLLPKPPSDFQFLPQQKKKKKKKTFTPTQLPRLLPPHFALRPGPMSPSISTRLQPTLEFCSRPDTLAHASWGCHNPTMPPHRSVASPTGRRPVRATAPLLPPCRPCASAMERLG